MNFYKISINIIAKQRSSIYSQSCLLNRKHNLVISMLEHRCISSHHVTKSIEFISKDNGQLSTKSMKQNLSKTEKRPLLLMLCWLLAKRKHVMKFANLYLEQGFDIALVSLSPWQLMWPTKGSRLVAGDVLNFLLQNGAYSKVLVHGFSVGGYLWGEILDLIQSDRTNCDGVINRFVGQVWDSTADISELSIGTPVAVFPNNPVLQSMMKTYLECHMKTFYKQATQYYVRSSQLFHSTIVHAPALFLVSNTDPIGTVASNTRVRETMESLGMQTYMKIFDKSPHVGHLQKYPKEYVAELYAFLNQLDMIQNEEKIRARL
ncbi:uncharacterized protein l(2)k09913 [Prorops nasuta]|uniref:uncharacterized protein l(2)k09913 n=1 Tax=Prorops nasuta TaxID=863751 RepID=UPI0034CFFEBB